MSTAVAAPQVSTPQPAHAGLHHIEWFCELVGTALLMLGGLSAICLDFGPGSAVARSIPSVGPRLLITGLLFAGAGSLVAISPVGKRSGAHLNPAVTVAFWLQRHVHESDLAGYVLAQGVGALLGVGAARLVWGHRLTSSAVDYGRTVPGNGLGPAAAVAIEAAMTALMILVIFGMVSHPRTARWTPFVLWLLIAALVWQVAPYTGTSLNPARTLAPDVAARNFGALWLYVVGPLVGALAAFGIWSGAVKRRLLTAKLFHDERYVSTLRTLLPARAPG